MPYRNTGHPYMFISADEPIFQTVSRKNKNSEAGKMYEELYSLARRDMDSPVLNPGSVFPEREPVSAQHQNPDYSICRAESDRLLRFGFFGMVTGESCWKERLIEEFGNLSDSEHWPEWRDQSHRQFPADLRTGMLASSAATAFDWIHPQLTRTEKDLFLRGITDKGISPYLISLPEKPFWIDVLNNWLTVVVGGMGITGIALFGHLKEAGHLYDFSKPRMERYLSTYGPRGEFNESPAYANANGEVVRYYAAADPDRLSRTPFPEMGRWVMNTTLPTGCSLPFGDCHPDKPVRIAYIAGIAAAARDGVLQNFYLHYRLPCTDPVEYLWFDPDLPREEGDTSRKQGIFYQGHGKCIVSRGLDKSGGMITVYGKAGIEENHEHADIGEVCLDAGASRLLIDIGSPSMYPADFFGENRFRYYNAGTAGHNVPQINGDEQKLKELPIILEDNIRNDPGSWKLDLTPLYPAAAKVIRHVIHRRPDVLCVLDSIIISGKAKVSLPWHFLSEPQCTSDKKPYRFIIRKKKVSLTGVVEIESGDAYAVEIRRHTYTPPYDRGRLGDPLEQRKEPFLRISTEGSCRILSLFSVNSGNAAADELISTGPMSYRTHNGNTPGYTVSVSGDSLIVKSME
ncbi:MAG: heparinase II/III family protein [Spirochaetia bacterium]